MFVAAFVFGWRLLFHNRLLRRIGRGAQWLRNQLQRGKPPPLTDLPARLVVQRDEIRDALGDTWWKALLFSLANWLRLPGVAGRHHRGRVRPTSHARAARVLGLDGTGDDPDHARRTRLRGSGTHRSADARGRVGRRRGARGARVQLCRSGCRCRSAESPPTCTDAITEGGRPSPSRAEWDEVRIGTWHFGAIPRRRSLPSGPGRELAGYGTRSSTSRRSAMVAPVHASRSAQHAS